MKNTTKASPAQQWKIVEQEIESHRTEEELKKNGYSPDAPIFANGRKRVVLTYNEHKASGGLADRIKGIISVYKTCKELGIEFKIHFTHPFNLNRYLAPNLVDWSIKEEELNYNTGVTDVCYVPSRIGSKEELEMQEEWFRKEFDKDYREFHVTTNAAYCYKYDFHTLFNELFRPTEHSERLLTPHKRVLKEGYISTSFRFLDLLNDFNEVSGRNLKLSAAEQEKLITESLYPLELLHRLHPRRPILVNSDSTRFLQAAARLRYTYIIPGEISHIDNKRSTGSDNAHDKMFTDFLMIANAGSIYMFKTNKLMFTSGFPKQASLINRRPYYKVRNIKPWIFTTRIKIALKSIFKKLFKFMSLKFL